MPVACERRLPPARRLATQTEISRQLRQTHQALFYSFNALQATGPPISVIAQQLGCNRRRLTSGRSRASCQNGTRCNRHRDRPKPSASICDRAGMPVIETDGCCSTTCERWAMGARTRRSAKFYHPGGWEMWPSNALRTTSRSPSPSPAVLTERQISPQIAAALLTTPRPELTGRNAQIVDA